MSSDSRSSVSPEPRFVPLEGYARLSDAEMGERVRSFLERARMRRTVRDFAPDAVPRGIVEDCIRAAATAPNGANHQPWHFVLVGDPERKRRIREAAEAEERHFYEERAPSEWLAALGPLGTGPAKPFLETAPWLIAVFGESRGLSPDGSRRKNYYVTESVGLATGILITALHAAGLATLTHTPSPMRFLNEVLGRPDRERAFLLLVVGHPAADARVPAAALEKKSFDQICTVHDHCT